KVQRGIAMPDRRRVLIQDEFEATSPAEVWWFLHTTADLKTDGRTATLSLHGKHLIAHILSPTAATFIPMNARPLPPCPAPSMQNTNRGLSKLAIGLDGVTRERIAVLL